MTQAILETSGIQELIRMIEEATRSTKEGVKYFVEPARGTLQRVLSKRHHIVFGRRGSGKSSLLIKGEAELTIKRRPSSYVDLEAFKGHSYPDVLLSVLISTFRGFLTWLQGAAITPATKKSFWHKVFGRGPEFRAYNKKDCAALAQDIDAQIRALSAELHKAVQADTVEITGAESGASLCADASSEVRLPIGSFRGEVSAAEHQDQMREVQERYTRDKLDFLHRHILDYQEIFTRMARVSIGDAFLLLDDLYQIRRSDQARVIDYFHRVAKGNSLWLKVATIRHRSSWYVHGDPPVGLKLGDDADDINLDLTLEKYKLARDFLKKVLYNFAEKCGVLPIDSFLTSGALDRLVLACGGVARDFLTILRRSVDVARERHGGSRGDRISVEDVNVAAGEHDNSKRDEFKLDTSDDDRGLNEEFDKLRDYCLNNANSNCFLLDQSASGPEVRLIHELVDLKLLHLVRSRVTVSSRPGRLYEGYMLDVSQYAGTRKKRGLEEIQFWKSDSQEKLRRASMIYDIA